MDKMKSMQQEAILPPDCGKKSLDATPLEALRSIEDVDVVSEEVSRVCVDYVQSNRSLRKDI